jgi:polyisoprenoid-binding protein YceI
MKENQKFPLFCLLGLLMLIATTGNAQTTYVLAPSPVLKVSGGSSLHDWDMTTQTAKAEGVFIVEGGQFKSAKSLTLIFQAESLKSGTSGLDKNAYKALKTEKNKEIRFVLKEFSGSGTSFTAKGDLTIAGVTKPVSLPMTLTAVGDKFQFEGSVKTKLTFFNIDPPTALMGTVKTHDDVTLTFKTTFQP